MKRFLPIFLALLMGCNIAFAQEQIVDFEKRSLPVLNEELRKIRDRAEDSKDLTSEVSGILPLANGGTAIVYVDPDADRIFFWDDSEGEFGSLTVGTGLAITGTTLNAEEGSSTSNVIFSWSGVDNFQANNAGAAITQVALPDFDTAAIPNNLAVGSDNTTPRVLLNFRFKKIAGISTITIEARMASSGTATCLVNIGGQSNSVTRASASYGWATAADIDVSGLSDGTTYDGTIAIGSNIVTVNSLLSAITLIAS